MENFRGNIMAIFKKFWVRVRKLVEVALPPYPSFRTFGRKLYQWIIVSRHISRWNRNWKRGNFTPNFIASYFENGWSAKCKIDSTFQRKTSAVHRVPLSTKNSKSGLTPKLCGSVFRKRDTAQNVKWTALFSTIVHPKFGIGEDTALLF